MSATTIAIVAAIVWFCAMGLSWYLGSMNALSAIFVAGSPPDHARAGL